MEIERSTYITIILAAIFLILGTLTAHAQTATPTATPTPGVCSINTLPNGLGAVCATGAEPPPSFLGVSGGNYNAVSTDKKSGQITCCTGTLGALVTNGTSDFVLSSSHVFARNSSTSKSAAANEALVQPGLVDLGCFQDQSDTIAKLSNWTKLNFSGGANTLDAALGKVVDEEQTPGGPLVPGVDPDGEMLNIVSASDTGQVVGQISSTPFPFNGLFDGMPVVKQGRSTCLTSGRIDAFDAMGKVVYTPKVCNSVAGGTAFFNHQILVIGVGIGDQSSSSCTFAKSGDAGSMVLSALDFTEGFNCPQAIGIVFAGTPGAGTPYNPETDGAIVAVNPIDKILSKFSVSLVGKSCSSAVVGPALDNGGLITAAGATIPGVSAAHWRSIEQVRAVKNRHAARLMKMDEVTAVGIGSGDDRDHAALVVYLSKDTPAIRAKISSRIDGVKVKFKHAQKFNAL